MMCKACESGLEPGTLAHTFEAPDCNRRPKRGGPRPGFGGKQPGAGRPVKPVGDKPIKINLPPDAAALLDALRGEVSRAGFVEQMVRREAEGRKG